MRPPATKGNKKRDKLGDNIGDKTSGRRTNHPTTRRDTLRKLTPTVHCLKKCKIRLPTTKGNKKKDKLGDKLGDMKEDKLGDKGDKTWGRRTHHPTQAKKRETIGGQGGDKTSRKWTHHPTQVTCGETMGDKRRQDLGKAGTTANTGTRGDNGRQGLLKADMVQGGDTIQHRHQCGEFNGRQGADKTSEGGPAQAHMWGDNGRQLGGQWETMGDTGRQDVKKADTPSNTGTHI